LTQIKSWSPDMLEAAILDDESLPLGHPCFGCKVRTHAMCRVLGCDDLAAMRRLGRSLNLRAGQPLFHEGDPADRVFTLTGGALKHYKLLADGRRQVTGFLFPGDFLGISVDEEYGFTAEALVDSQLCWFPRNRFDDFVGSFGQLERELYHIAARELAAARSQILLLGRKTACERLASFFLSLLLRAEKIQGETMHMVELPMNRTDIADYLGLTKETVSRTLASLKNDRIVRLDSLNRVEVLDRSRLVGLAEGEGA
jgi:CRP/FNR family transcriptional regulator